MKKFLVLLLIFISMGIVKAGTSDCLFTYNNTEYVKPECKTDYNFSTTKKIIQEVMKDYYIRGENIQYQASRRKIPGLPPEDATSQDRQYHVCAGYYYNIFYEAFNMNSKSKNYLEQSMDAISQARNYYLNKIKGKENNSSYVKYRDGHFLLFYKNAASSSSDSYIYGNNYDFSEFVKKLQPGDVIEWVPSNTTGHYIVVYDLVKDLNGKVTDALILNSTGYATIPSRLYGVRNLRYISKKPTKNNIIDISVEGTIQWGYLSKMSRIVKKVNGKNTIGCYKQGSETGGECMVMRIYYNYANSGKTGFNFDMTKTAYARGLLRTKYPAMVIEKTVDKFDNNGVYPGDKLTYTIKITNKSNVTNKGADAIAYEKFTIKETIDTTLVGNFESKNCTLSGKEITCVVSSKIAAGNSKTLTYSVKVKDNNNVVGKVIESTGKFYGNYESIKNTYITTGTVSNKILPKISATANNSIDNCIKEAKDNKKTELNFVDYVYNCAYGKNYNFNKLSFTDLFTRTVTTKKDSSINKYKTSMSVSFNKNISEVGQVFKNMMLNDYWGAVIYSYKASTSESESKKALGYIGGSFTKGSKYVVNQEDFKDGDVLIYYINYKNSLDGKTDATKDSLIHTDEKGYYAFIYSAKEKKFIGYNYPGKANERNEFTHNYYKTHGSYKADLYNKVDELSSTQKDKILTIANYETLIDKDYFIILRPTIVMTSSITPTDQASSQTAETTEDSVSDEITLEADDDSIAEEEHSESSHGSDTQHQVEEEPENHENENQEPENNEINNKESNEQKEGKESNDSVIKIIVIAVILLIIILLLAKIIISRKKNKEANNIDNTNNTNNDYNQLNDQNIYDNNQNINNSEQNINNDNNQNGI